MPIRIIPLPTTIVVSSSSSSSSSSTRKTTTMTKRCSSWTTIFFSTVTMLMFLLLLFIVQVSGHSGQNQPMIIPTNGWIAIEVVTEGDLFQSSTSSNLWEMPKYMDGIGAFLVPPNNNTTPNNEILRINVNHEDEDEASVSEINIDVYKLKQTISNHVSMTTDHDGGSSASSISVMSKRSSSSADDENGEDYFIQSVRLAYDRMTEDGGINWSSNVDKSHTQFCRFCSSQYYPAEPFGIPNYGFQDPMYITGEECEDGRLIAIDINNPNKSSTTKDLYVVSGITGSMPSPTQPPQTQPPVLQSGMVISSAIERDDDLYNIDDDDDDYDYDNDEEDYYYKDDDDENGGMPFDSWENAALIDTGETEYVALVLSADGGSETLRLYIGKKNTNTLGNYDDINFLARNGLLYGRYYYLGGKELEWEENEETGMWEFVDGTGPGRFVTDEDDAWSESKFEDIDTNPNKPTQIVLAESNYGVYVLDFHLLFHQGIGFVPDESYFTLQMITNERHVNIHYPDNVDWTKNDLIFVNKDDDTGGIWYMNPDGSNKIKVGQTRDGGESTGILDVSNLLHYPPSSTIITSNQGTPSSMTLLINPSLRNYLLTTNNNNDNDNPVDDGPVVDAATTDPSPPITSLLSSPTAVSPPPIIANKEPIIIPVAVVDEDKNNIKTSTKYYDCPEGNSDYFQLIQAEDATLYSATIRTNHKNYCGSGYVDFEDIPDDETTTVGIGNGFGNFVLRDGIGGNIAVVKKTRQANTNNNLTGGIVGISFEVDINVIGSYTVSVRYGNGGGLKNSRPGTFLVDGIDIGDDFKFDTTFGWNLWNIETKTIKFNTIGRHTFDLFWIGSNKNRPNLDWLSIRYDRSS